MAVELNDAVDAQAFQQYLLGTMQQYQAVQREIMTLKAEYDVPLEDADLSPDEERRLEDLEGRSAFLEDTLAYWNHDAADHGYNLLT